MQGGENLANRGNIVTEGVLSEGGELRRNLQFPPGEEKKPFPQKQKKKNEKVSF